MSSQSIPVSPADATATAAQGLRVEMVSTWEDALRLVPHWDALLESSLTCTVFLTREWLTSWWTAYAKDEELALLLCRDADSHVIGVFPLCRSQQKLAPGGPFRVLRLIGDGTYDSDNLSIIVQRGFESAAIRAWLDWLEANRSEWEILEMNTLPAESPVSTEIFRQIRSRGWHCLEEERPHAFLPLPADWSAYLKSLSGNMRTSIETRTRKLEKQHRVTFRRCETLEELPLALEVLFRLHQKRWESLGESGAMKKQGRPALFAEVAAKTLARGWLDFWILEADGQIVAAEFGFRYGDTESFLQGGFDPAWSAKSVGLVLKARILRQLIESGAHFYDFLGGGEEYKLRWGAELRKYQFARFAPPWSRAAFVLDSIRISRNAKEWLRTRIPLSFWETLRRGYRTLRPWNRATHDTEK